MFDMFVVLLVSIFTMITSLILTPLFTHMAIKIGITDDPESKERRVHKKRMPTMGGVIIYVSFYIAVFFYYPYLEGN